MNSISLESSKKNVTNTEKFGSIILTFVLISFKTDRTGGLSGDEKASMILAQTGTSFEPI